MPQRLSCTRDSFFCIDQNGFPSHYMIATIVASTVVGAIVGGIVGEMKTGDSRKAFDASLMGMVGGFISSFFLISAANMMVQGIHYCRSRITRSNTERAQSKRQNPQSTDRDSPSRRWSADDIMVYPMQQNDLQTRLIDHEQASEEINNAPEETSYTINP